MWWGEAIAHNPCYTDSVAKNLTLTMDEDVLRAARKIALDRKTSVNQMVRDYLSQVVRAQDGQQAALRELKRIFRTSPYRIGKRTWTRDELHDRR